MKAVAIVLCAMSGAMGLTLGGAAEAAPRARSLPVTEPVMQIQLVRSAQPGCEPQCPEWIAAQGRIEAGTAARFRKVLRQLGDRKVPVLIDSSGGRVAEAFEIGRLARSKGLDVVVSRTTLAPCPAADTQCRRRARSEKIRLGMPEPDLSKCASACAFVLAAGTRRIVGPSAFVGVHQIRSFYVYAKVMRTYRVTERRRQLVSERMIPERIVETRTPQRTYDDIRSYFKEMGVGEGVMALILATPGDRLHWMTRGELESTRLATELDDEIPPATKVAAPAGGLAVTGGPRPGNAAVEAAAPASAPLPAGRPTDLDTRRD